jgi:SNF2 family DNA or RNA helicase
MKFIRAQPFDDPDEFRRTILLPFERGDPTVFASLRILVDAVVLRRNKDELDGLPAKQERTLMIEMTGNDRRCYDKLIEGMSELVDRKRSSGSRVFRGDFLKGLMRIRRFCAHKQELLAVEDLDLFQGLVAEHPVEILDDEDEAKEDDGSVTLTRQVAMDMVRLTRDSDCEECGVCGISLAVDTLDAEEDPKAVYGHMITCYQILCRNCFSSWRKGGTAASRCRFCNEKHGYENFKILRAEVVDFLRNQEMLQSNSRVKNMLGRYTGPSTKVQYLIENLNVFREYNKAHPDHISKAYVLLPY